MSRSSVLVARRSGAALAILVCVLAGCAAHRATLGDGGGPGRAAREGLDALVVRGDAALSRARIDAALAGDPGDPWARMGAALLARRSLDRGAETGHLLALVAAAPTHPLAVVALKRLADLVDDAPERALQVERGLAPLAGSGRLAGVGAYRARVARISAAEAMGDLDAVVRLRSENGAVSAWSLVGPFGLHHALDFDRPEPPEQGTIPAAAPARDGLPGAPTRTLPVPDGTATLEGEPPDGAIFYLAADVTLARGGRYLFTLGATGSAKVFLDGAVVAERRAFAGHPPSVQHLRLALARGRHRVVVKLARGSAPAALHVAFAREDGAPSDATSAPAPVGAAPALAAAPGRPAPLALGRDLARALEGGGVAVSRLLAGRDVLLSDRETAKALLDEGLAVAPASPALHAARADAASDDPTLDDGVARSRAEGELLRALERDPAEGEARVTLAALLRVTERLDDAEAALAALSPAEARTPVALASRARVAAARGFSEKAEALAAEARHAGGSCDALDLAAELAGRRQAVAAEDDLAQALARCRGGRDRLARHLARRGDPRGGLAALEPVVRARPAALEPALARAAAFVAAGERASAIQAVEALRAIWPRSARVVKRLAELRELAGDRRAARALREEALRLDPSDLALRRALALEDGHEVLDAFAEDGRAAIRAYEAAPRREDASSSMVLDAAAIELHPGGAATERIHQVVRLLDQRAVDEYGEVTLPAGAEPIAIRTVKADGRVLEPDRTATGKGSTSLAGLEPGDYVDLEYLRGTRGRSHGGGYAADPFYFQVSGTRLFRSSYVVVAPEGLGLEVDAHGMPAPQPRLEDGREVVRVVRDDVPALVPEPGSPPQTEYLPFVHVGVGGGRDALQRSLGDAAVERTRPTLELRTLAADIRAAAGPSAPPEALVRAAYARVAKTILGQGGPFADDASEVLSRGRGSRLVVLKAVLSILGARTRIALVRAFSADPTPYRFPGMTLYGQPLLRVELGGKTFWLDPSLRSMPFGAIPANLEDCDALVLPEPGDALEVARTPRSAVVDGEEAAVRVALAADGSAELQGTDEYRGHGGAEVKSALEPIDPKRRRQAVEMMLSRSFRGLSVTDVAIEGEEDPEAPLRIRWKGRAPSLARAADGSAVVDAPILAARLAARYVQLASRTTPLLVGVAERVSQRIEIVPPAGLVARPEEPRRVSTPFGTYTRRERVEKGALVREERLEVLRGRIPPARYAEFAAFATAVDELQERPTVFRR